MDRLAEQVVLWHNSHPLAKRISIYDVHTIGVVALPFMRSGGAGLPGAARGPVEPVLTDAVSTESLAAWGTEESTIAANTNAAHLDALADQEEPPTVTKPSWRERLLKLFKRGDAGAKDSSWPAFSERFVDKLSPRRIAQFAQQHGYSVRPGDASWPHRVVPIDDKMMSGSGAAGGAWPFEMYLMSAAIDAGRSRTRILAGRSAGAALPPVLGRRCLDAKRVALAALVPLCVFSAAGAAWWRSGADSHETGTMAAAAGAASAAASSAASGSTTHVAEAAASAAPDAASEASTAMAAASEASAPIHGEAPALVAANSASAPANSEAAASEPAPAIPDIRPRLVETTRPSDGKTPPLLGSATPAKATASMPAAVAPTRTMASAKGGSAPAAASPASSAMTPPPAAPEVASLPITPVKPDVQAAAKEGTPVVALVAPPMRNKAEAEATLARMRELVLPLHPAGADAMQAQLFDSPEGWRPAVWPFATRIEAQLVNATLVARGLHTKAVDF